MGMNAASSGSCAIRTTSIGLLGLLLLSTPACSGSGDSVPRHPSEQNSIGAVPASESSRRTNGQGTTPVRSPSLTDERPAAMIDGRSVDSTEYRAMLAESAGGVVFEELILESSLRRAMQEAGQTLTPAMVNAERTQLSESLARATRATPEDGERLIESVRRNRGLGQVRFQKLLERNAMLRVLVRKQGDARVETVTEDDIKQAYAIKYGPRVRARLMLLRSLDSATKALARVQTTAASPGEPFGEVASQVSVDPTSARGGLMDPISVADPNYPVAVRRAIENLAVGAVTQPIAVSWPSANNLPPEQGYAILKIEEQIAATGPDIASVHDDLRKEIQMVRERAAMDFLAKSLIEQGTLKSTIFDPSLDWSWSQRQAR